MSLGVCPPPVHPSVFFFFFFHFQIYPPSRDAETWLIVSLGCGEAHIVSALQSVQVFKSYCHLKIENIITRTGSCVETPVTRYVYKKSGVYRGVHHFIYQAAKHNIMGIWQICLSKVILTSTNNPCLIKNKESIIDYQLKNNIPRAMKASTMLHRYVTLSYFFVCLALTVYSVQVSFFLRIYINSFTILKTDHKKNKQNKPTIALGVEIFSLSRK